MGVRQTSIDCYNEIKANGLLSKRRMEVYEILFHHGQLTANEIVRVSKAEYPNTNPSSFHARLSELKRYGVIIEVGEKRDEVSGNNCYIWDLTDNLPSKSASSPKQTKKEKIKNTLKVIVSLGLKLEKESEKEDLREIYGLVENI